MRGATATLPRCAVPDFSPAFSGPWDFIGRDDTVERQIEIAALKSAARRYSRSEDLAAALDLSETAAGCLTAQGAIRRLTRAIAELRAPVHGRLAKQKTIDAKVFDLRVALLCERLCRHRERATAARLCFDLARERVAVSVAR